MDGSSHQKLVTSRDSCPKSDRISKFGKIDQKVQRFNRPVHDPGSGRSAHVGSAHPLSHAVPEPCPTAGSSHTDDFGVLAQVEAVILQSDDDDGLRLQ
jgi:hypothetical protein